MIDTVLDGVLHTGKLISPGCHGLGKEDLVGTSNTVIDGVPEEFFCFLFVCAAYPFSPCAEGRVLGESDSVHPHFPCAEGRILGGGDSVHQHLKYEVRAEGCAAYIIFCGSVSIL